MKIMKEFYVSPYGSDENPGTETKPFKTIKRARNAVREINEYMNGDIIVYLREGEYILKSTFVLTEEDSGRNNYNVIYQAYPGEKPLISGGIKITDWILHDSKKNIYKSFIGKNVMSRQVYVNGKRAIRARSKNPIEWVKKENGYENIEKYISQWKNTDKIEVVGRYDWKMFRGRIERIENNHAFLQEPFWHNSQLHSPWVLGKIDWIENAYELLDSEGEWYIDENEGYIYYIPRQEEDMGNIKVILPYQEVLIKAYNINNMVFKDITFSFASWNKPSSHYGYCSVQAGCLLYGNKYEFFDNEGDYQYQMDGNIEFEYARDIVFENNYFMHLGATALKFGRGCKYNSIINNQFMDISGTAVSLGRINDYYYNDNNKEVVSNNIISGNIITGIGIEYNDCPAIFVGMTQETSIIRNKIFNIPYTGISVGWGWGYYDRKPTVQKKNKIMYNHIYKYMQQMMDGGGIYYLSASPDTTISYNYIHDAGRYCPGIYLDGGCKHIIVEHNVIENVYEAISAQNKPNTENIIRYNYYSAESEFNVCSSNIAVDNFKLENGKKWPKEREIIIKMCTEK